MEQMIAAHEICNHYHVEYSFINSLSEVGLIQLTTIEEDCFLPSTDLPKLEKWVRLHNDLAINIEGLEAISCLLQKIEEMQEEIIYLKNKLRVFDAQ
jgi:hypothetical protein